MFGDSDTSTVLDLPTNILLPSPLNLSDVEDKSLAFLTATLQVVFLPSSFFAVTVTLPTVLPVNFPFSSIVAIDLSLI